MEEKQERVDKVEEHIKKDFFFKKKWTRGLWSSF